jgi:small subunit ribosomal protein S20
VKLLPNIKSAKKRVKISEKKTLKNQSSVSALKTAFKKYDKAVADGNHEDALESYKVAVKKIDQAAAQGHLHKNTAARKKSQFAKKLNSMGV